MISILKITIPAGGSRDLWRIVKKKQQPGNPNKLAEVLIKAVQSENPPFHLGIGEAAPDVMYGFAEKIKDDTDAWIEIASDTSFEN